MIPWTEIRSTYSTQSLPSQPLSPLHSQQVLNSHQTLISRERSLDLPSNSPRNRKVVIGNDGVKHQSQYRKGLKGLKEVKSLVDLRCNEISTGRYILFRIKTLAIRTSSIQFVVQDQNGFLCSVQLFHVPYYSTTTSSKGIVDEEEEEEELDLKQTFPVGSVFAVKEPFFKSTNQTPQEPLNYYLRIESPSDFVRIDHPYFLTKNSFSSLSPTTTPSISSSPYHGRKQLSSSSSSTSPLPPNETYPPHRFFSSHRFYNKSFSEVKRLGNESFKLRRWMEAKESYLWSLGTLLSEESSSLGRKDRVEDGNTQRVEKKEEMERMIQIITLRSNLALTNLKMGLFRSTKRECRIGLRALSSLFSSSSLKNIDTSTTEKMEMREYMMCVMEKLERKLEYRLSLALYEQRKYQDTIKVLLNHEPYQSLLRNDNDHTTSPLNPTTTTTTKTSSEKNRSESHQLGEEERSLIEKCHQRLQEQNSGQFNFVDLYKTRLNQIEETSSSSSSSFSSKRNNPRGGGNGRIEVSNYFNESALKIVEIEGKGRGIVSTRRIERGESLMVFNPIIQQRTIEGRGLGKNKSKRRRMQYLEGLNCWTEEIDPWSVVEVENKLCWMLAQEEQGGGGGMFETNDGEEEAEDDEDLEKIVRELWAGEELGRIGSTSESSEGKGVYSPSRIEGIVTFNGFRIEDIVQPRSSTTSFNDTPSSPHHSDRHASEEDSSSSSPSTALYPIPPSSLNHSCLPNSSYTFISSLFILRARTTIEEDEEVTISYVDQGLSYEERERKFRKHGFVCLCGRCQMERNEGMKDVRVKPDRLKKEFEKLQKDEERSLGIDYERKIETIKRQLEETYSSLPLDYNPQYEIVKRLRSELYPITRILSEISYSRQDFQRSISFEIEGLESLGTVITYDDDGEPILVEPPVLGDMNAVLSSLWIAKMYNLLGQSSKSRCWIEMAREIEKGQGGAELLELRFGEWARQNGLEIGVDTE